MSTVSLYPLLCRPVLKSRIWGGRRLEALFGKDLPPGEMIGEAWEVADLPEGASTVANGPDAGLAATVVVAAEGVTWLEVTLPE